MVFFSLSSDSFLNIINLRNILAQVSTLAVVSTGITFVLLCGEIDLSIAAVATTVTVSFIALGFLTALVCYQLVDLADDLPQYQQNMWNRYSLFQ